MKKIKEFGIMVDLDGVLANWEIRVRELLGEDYATAPKGKKWAYITRYNDNVAPFYETLPKMEDADELWGFITSTFQFYSILSACGTTPKNANDQKRKWIRTNLGEVNTIIVPDGKDKAIYANSRMILIDDRKEKVIAPWTAAGGIGVLHTNAADTIDQLKTILNLK